MATALRTLLVASAVALAVPAVAQQARPLAWSLQQSFVFDSNVLRLPDQLSPAAFGGPSRRSDWSRITSAGLSIDKNWGLQRLNADIGLQRVSYDGNSRLDHDGHHIDLGWQWEYGRRWFGAVQLRDSRSQVSFAELDSRNAGNLIRRDRLRTELGYRLTPSWAAYAAAQIDRRDNERGDDVSDWRQNAWETGLRYAPGSGTTISVLARIGDGRYPNRSGVDAMGNPLPLLVDNGYRHHDLLLRAQLVPSDKSRLSAHVGVATRRFDNLGQRDFSGPVWSIDAGWYPSDAWQWNVSLRRDIGAAETLSANYVDVQALLLSAAWRPTAKLGLQASLQRQTRSYDGDPGFVLGAGPLRKDRLNVAGLSISWEWRRTIRLFADLRREHRDSNSAFFRYDADVLAIGASLNID
ncbi:MAG: XrtB/PEP-CTERM-associated polysaccharide biosynthesis outer membrane protein EpsL [Burkholderiaceae bacterium]